jgi:type VI secretion system protein ImpG
MSTEQYQNELNNLRELAVEFAEKHPTLAPQLSGPSPDPDVERILEGVAFLTGNIREKLDDDFPEFAQSLMQMIFPHYLRPLPSATIIKFSAKDILKTSLAIAKNTFVDSQAVDEVSCRFKTCYDINIAPVRVSGVEVKEIGSSRKSIDVHLSFSGVNFGQWAGDALRFYIGGDYVGAVDLLMLLQTKLTGIDVISSSDNRVLQLPPSALRTVGFDDDSALIPFPSNSFPAYRTIQEYFLFKEKFLFIELGELSAVGSSSALTLRFKIDNVDFKLPKIGPDRFELFTTPAINLFEHAAEPIKLNNRQSELRVKPGKGRGRGASDNYQIYSIDSVIGSNRKVGSDVEYHSIDLFRSFHSNEPVYQITYRLNDDSRLAQPYLNISYPPDYELPGKETLSIELTCTNGTLPSRLRPGDINKPTSSTSELVEFSNITPPTETQQPPMGGALLWRLLSHLSLNYLSLADAQNLRALLGLYIFPGSSSRKDLAINQKRLEGISSVVVTPEDQLVRGALLRGQRIDIALDKDFFASMGDLYLFACLLEKLFNSFSSVNCFTQLCVKEVGSGEEFTWPAKMGTRSLI